MKFRARGKRNSGFSLLELVVAFSLSFILVVIVASMVDAGSRWSGRIQADMSTRRDGKMVLDYLERDLTAITPAEPGRMTFSMVPDIVRGNGDAKVSSLWLMLLSRPAVSSGMGGIRTVSYRVVHTDPMTPGGTSPRFVLFRSEISPDPESDNSFLSAPDLHADYWQKKWRSYEKGGAGRTLLDDYLLENVVDFRARANYTYRDLSGTQLSGSSIEEKTVSWTSRGFDGDGIPVAHTPNIPRSITLTLTLLSAHGMTLFEAESLPFPEIIRKEGFKVTRTFPILSGY